ncbi:MAG TPA: class I SAM-dependent methyltransferase [Thermoleophilaceae bacterium]|nr:class I SAM-dependent methyltransferase [Thermoleophilaceae bacterium]
MPEALPTSPDDERLRGWYHTIELGDGLVSRGIYDHRPIVDCYGLPKSLRGKTALDVGTWDGFWAFELERRGADRVVAVDIPSFEDFDWLPWIRESLGALRATRPHFDLAHAMRRSRVEHQSCSVYDLSPEQVGTFDVVFCGSLLLHLQNPLRALVNIRSVTNELAIIETLLDPELDPYDRPWLAFGHREVEARLGEAAVYWKFSTRALREMMEYAGFSSTQPLAPFSLPPAGPQVVSVIGYPASTASLGVPST